ncbi:MAG: tRNA epoxyqueuosine(34) reductase QueG [Litorimonas sp.]
MVNSRPSNPLKALSKRAESLGFTRPHIVGLSTFGTKAGEGLQAAVSAGHHGSMEWLAETAFRRSHPQNLWPDAKSAIIFGMNYGPDSDPMVTLQDLSVGTISVYARGRDYHDIMKGRLKELAGLLARDTGEDVKVFVDTAPLMEKPLAMAAGLGWQGKHTNLVSRDFGSWLFIGSILSAAKLTPTPPELDHCGSCSACLEICPTKAFPAPYKLDARRCISYLTIEYAGAVDKDLREKMGNHIYGCDDCLAVCPWNKFAQIGQEVKLAAREDLNAPNLSELVTLGETGFRQIFSGSPIKRIGWPRFLRNVLYAIGNSKQTSLKYLTENYLTHEDAVVADAAQWASEQLSRNS